MRRDDTAIAAGLQKFVKLKNKDGERDFVGKDVCAKELEHGTDRCLVKMEVDIDNADAYGDNPIFTADDELIGWTTSGAYSHQSNRSLAWAYLKDGYEKKEDAELFVEIIGKRRPIRVISESLLK